MKIIQVVRTAILLGIAQLFLTQSGFAESVSPFRFKLPQARHYEAAAAGEDCAIYRTMRHRAENEIAQARVMEGKYAELLVQSRQALESCARQNGIEDIDEERDEVLVAEICAPFYQAWLKPASRLAMLGSDIRDAIEQRDLMSNRLQSYCGHLSSDNDEDGRKG